MNSATFLFLKDIVDFTSSKELHQYTILQLESYHGFPKAYLNDRFIQLNSDNEELSVFVLNTQSEYPYMVFAFCRSDFFEDAEKELIKICSQYELNSIAVLSAGKPKLVKYLQKNFQIFMFTNLIL